MEAQTKVRHWMRVKTRPIHFSKDESVRSPSLEDAPALAHLMDVSYQGTIDHEGETLEQCAEEMTGTLSGKYGPFLDFASFVAIHPTTGECLSAALITHWKNKPLVAFSMTAPNAQGRGLAGLLLERSIHALHERGYPELYLVVTQGNDRAQRLYSRLGFEDLGTSLPQQPPPSL